MSDLRNKVFPDSARVRRPLIPPMFPCPLPPQSGASLLSVSFQLHLQRYTNAVIMSGYRREVIYKKQHILGVFGIPKVRDDAPLEIASQPTPDGAVRGSSR